MAARRPPTPILVLAGLAAALAVAFAVPASRAWIMFEMIGPVRYQVAPGPGLRGGYTTGSMAAWAVLGLAVGYLLYELVFVRWGLSLDARLFTSLAPLLVFGPLYHALLVADAIPEGSFWAYLAAEPVVYLTAAALGVLGIAVGRRFGRPHDGLAFVGLVAAAAALVRAVDIAGAAEMGRAGGLLLIALVVAALLAPVGRRIAPEVPLAAGFAVIAAHALDGATTWLTLRDPFGWGFAGFSESNPLAERLVEMSNGWPYFAVKLALPLVLLAVVRTDDKRTPERTEEEQRRERQLQVLLLFAVFILGYGPGMSNLMQVLLA